MKTKSENMAIICVVSSILAILAIVVCVSLTYHPTGIEKDDHGNIVFATLMGEGDVIPEDSIDVIPMPKNLLTHLIRTNGASYRNVRYGHFKNTESGTRMFLYLTGKPDTICFTYQGNIYVTDDWRMSKDTSK